MDPSGNLQVLSDPTGSAAWWGVVQNAVILAIAVACWLVSLAGQVVSYRRSSGERRQQLKWLLGGSVASLAGAILAIALIASTWLPLA